MTKPPVIDHDPNEKPKEFGDGWLLWACFAGLALLWVWFFVFEMPHWVSVGMGFLTGGYLVAWATEVTGNKVPWSRPKK